MQTTTHPEHIAMPPIPVEVWYVDRPTQYIAAKKIFDAETNGDTTGDRMAGFSLVNWHSADTNAAIEQGRMLPRIAHQPGVWVRFSDETWARIED